MCEEFIVGFFLQGGVSMPGLHEATVLKRAFAKYTPPGKNYLYGRCKVATISTHLQFFYVSARHTTEQKNIIFSPMKKCGMKPMCTESSVQSCLPRKPTN